MFLETQWIVGFVDGEGCFHASLNKHSDMRLGVRPLPEFVVVQHLCDIQVLHALKSYFGCGVVRKNHGDRYCYRVRGISHLHDIILPFFEKHELKTKKRLEFITFRKIVRAMNNKEHLNEKGLEQIKKWMVELEKRQKPKKLDYLNYVQAVHTEKPKIESSGQ
jgi:hypothetical protein